MGPETDFVMKRLIPWVKAKNEEYKKLGIPATIDILIIELEALQKKKYE